jgi:predicted AAA+ superfamily ATPase
MSESEIFFSRANELLSKLEVLLPHNKKINFEDNNAYCWQYSNVKNILSPIHQFSSIKLNQLKCIDKQIELITRNTKQFIYGLPANNALLWGPRGTGKSSLIKALLNEYKSEGLKLIEIQRDDMNKLPEICDLLYKHKDRFILFCDDLSFEDNDSSYKAIKVILDGSVKQTPENILVYATSNRRHLVPERMIDNIDSGIIDGELHYGDTVEEKLSLSERFGLWVAFHPFNQENYLQIVEFWINKLLNTDFLNSPEIRKAALQWSLQHGSRSGRSAMLFSRDWVGKSGLKKL